MVKMKVLFSKIQMILKLRLEMCYIDTLLKSKWMTTTQTPQKKKEEGAELCQAQGKLNLFWPWLEPCYFDWLAWFWFANMAYEFKKIESKVFGKVLSLVSSGGLQVQKYWV